MNTKSFSIGFTAMDSLVAGISATKRSAINATKAAVRGAKGSVQTAKNGVVSTSEAVASFLAGMHHCARVRSGKCRLLTNEE